jgi:acyl-coenzyme A thioesterase PaaI-like protein
MRLDPILARVLRAIALNRTPGFNFPGWFLELSYDRVGKDTAVASLEAGAHNVDATGQMDIGALALLADMALASALRGTVGASARLATVTMQLQLTGAPRTGRLTASAAFDGFIEGTKGEQGMSRAEIRSGRRLVGHASGAFMVLGGHKATAPHPLPRRGVGKLAQNLHPEHLNAEEERVFLRAADAMRADGPFLANFWGYMPKLAKDGARCTATHGMHIGNRVGHAQGGVTFGLAAATAAAALGPGWALVSASAWYVGPGAGLKLRARSTIVHRGILTAVVHTRIEDDEKRGVLECVSSHARNQAIGDRR